MITLLIDEDSLGVDRFLGDLDAKIIKVGDIPKLPLGTPDPVVAKYTKKNNYIIITRDDKLVKQCKFFDVDVITLGMEDLAKKIVKSIQKQS